MGVRMVWCGNVILLSVHCPLTTLKTFTFNLLGSPIALCTKHWNNSLERGFDHLALGRLFTILPNDDTHDSGMCEGETTRNARSQRLLLEPLYGTFWNLNCNSWMTFMILDILHTLYLGML
jgi:hypothetical protein